MSAGGSAVGGSDGVGLGLGGWACSARSTVRVGSGGRVVESGREGGGSFAWRTCSASEGTGIVEILVGSVTTGSDRSESTVGSTDVRVFCRSVGCNGSNGGGFDD